MIAIGFDFDHTLGLDNGLERKAFYAYAQELGRPLDPRNDAWTRRIDDWLAKCRDDELTIDEAIRQFGAELGVNNAIGERWRAICFALVDELVEPIDGAREMLDTLRKRGIPMAILTNGWTPLQQKKIARALGPSAIQPLIVSDQVGATKPDSRAFAALVQALDVPRVDVWYVGDNPRADVGGALEAGLRAVWFDWENIPYPEDLPPPTIHIHALRELEGLVENTIAP